MTEPTGRLRTLNVGTALIGVTDSLVGHFGDWGAVSRFAAGPWPAEDVERFHTWIDDGSPP
jgi:hypothetical protein